MKFEWDHHKAEINQTKHGVSFQEGASVFGDPMALTFDDPDHSYGERRLLTFGMSKNGRMLVVSHTEDAGSTRIISARPMSKRERSIYEEG